MPPSSTLVPTCLVVQINCVVAYVAFPPLLNNIMFTLCQILLFRQSVHELLAHSEVESGFLSPRDHQSGKYAGTTGGLFTGSQKPRPLILFLNHVPVGHFGGTRLPTVADGTDRMVCGNLVFFPIPSGSGSCAWEETEFDSDRSEGMGYN